MLVKQDLDDLILPVWDGFLHMYRFTPNLGDESY